MGMNFTFTVALLALSTIALTCKAQTSGATGVFVNGQELSASQLSQLEQTTGSTVAPGQYWYDGVAGAYGCMGGPTKGLAPPGLQAAPLPATASNGNTGVFINGRELPTQDLNLLQQAIKTSIQPGRYWVRSDRSYGVEGNPTPIGTLATSGGSGGSSSSGGGGGCTTTNGGNTICSGDGVTSVSGEDSLHNPWSVSSDSGRKLSFARGRPYNIAGKKLLQQTVSCPADQSATTSTTPSTLGTASTPGSSAVAGAPVLSGSPGAPGPAGAPGSASGANTGGSTAGGQLAAHGSNGARATAGLVAVLHAALCCLIVVQQLVF